MTTATSEQAKVILNGSEAPKRRGRPKGSKNKPKDGATVTAPRRRVAAPAKAATQTRVAPRASVALPKVHAVLVTSDGFEVLRGDGSTEKLPVNLTDATLYDRRK